MRIFIIKEDGKFEEFSQTHFHVEHEEAVLEKWLENNPNDILGDGKLLIIGRQVTTNLGSIIDLLGVDREGNTVVIELKRNSTPRDTLAQALEYASFVEELDTDQLEAIFQNYVNDDALNIAEYHRSYFELAPDEAVSFNKEQRIVLVGQRITDEIRQTASFLRRKGLRVTCLEFSYFQANDGKHLLSCDIVVGKEPIRKLQISSGALPVVTQEFFMKSLDKNGQEAFSQVLEYADMKSLSIRWGTKGFSMNVYKNGVHIPICFGYPPSSVFKQSIYTALVGGGGFLNKLKFNVSVPESDLKNLWKTDLSKYCHLIFESEPDLRNLWEDAQNSGLFQQAGRELKVSINRKLKDNEIKILIDWLDKLVQFIEKHELK